jgi:hypothetical protein
MSHVRSVTYVSGLDTIGGWSRWTDLNRRYTDYDCGFGLLLPVAPCLIKHLQLHMIALYFTPECGDPLQARHSTTQAAVTHLLPNSGTRAPYDRSASDSGPILALQRIGGQGQRTNPLARERATRGAKRATMVALTN